MNRWMNRAARGALEGVDAAVLVIEAGRWDDDDTLAYEALKSAGVPVVLAVNQVDRIKDKTALLPFLAKVSEGRDFAAVHPVSALKRKGLEALVRQPAGAGARSSRRNTPRTRSPTRASVSSPANWCASS